MYKSATKLSNVPIKSLPSFLVFVPREEVYAHISEAQTPREPEIRRKIFQAIPEWVGEVNEEHNQG